MAQERVGSELAAEGQEAQEPGGHERVGPEPKRETGARAAQKQEAVQEAAARGGSGRGGAYVITGPTSGIGRRTALELAAHGTVVLVGRDPGKLGEVQRAIESGGGKAVTVVCDLSDSVAVRRAAVEIVGLGLPLAGLVNNA